MSAPAPRGSATRPGPAAGRPNMPASYGVLDAADGRGLIPWSRAVERLSGARNYWVGTTRPDGKPHAVPVWGVWLDGTFYFGTDRRSRKARNLAAHPALVVHLESGDDVVILEGAAGEVTDPSLLGLIDDAYFAKYHVHLTGHPGDVVVYGLRPHVAFAWQESDLPGSATRWLFGEEP